MKRTDVERLKAFLARKKGHGNPQVRARDDHHAAECIFVGTTNSSEYLQSKTGNRRFWPVRIGKIDIAAIRNDRDQLWAEAAHYEALGTSHMLPEEFWNIAAEEQEKRREADLWEGEIRSWLEERRSSPNPLVTPAEVAQSVLCLHLKDLDGGSQRRIYEAMRLAGWSKDTGKTVRGRRFWGPTDG